jgi:hypothetical protein
MPTRQEKIKAVRAYARDLQEFASEFSNGASVATSSPDNVVDFLYAISVETNRLHNGIAERFEHTTGDNGQ